MGMPEGDPSGNCFVLSGILSFPADNDSLVEALLGRAVLGGLAVSFLFAVGSAIASAIYVLRRAIREKRGNRAD